MKRGVMPTIHILLADTSPSSLATYGSTISGVRIDNSPFFLRIASNSIKEALNMSFHTSKVVHILLISLASWIAIMRRVRYFFYSLRSSSHFVADRPDPERTGHIQRNHFNNALSSQRCEGGSAAHSNGILSGTFQWPYLPVEGVVGVGGGLFQLTLMLHMHQC